MDNQLTQQDSGQLRSLAIAFRVVSGLVALYVNVMWFSIFIGIQMATAPPSLKSSNAIEPSLCYLLSAIALAIIISGYVMGYIGFKTASALEQRRNWEACKVIAIAFLFAQPLGTVLGILALIVLHRPSVKQSFTQ